MFLIDWILKIKLFNYISNFYFNNENEFVNFRYFQKPISKTKVVAFYLPQFHQTKENNEWHGMGFTDWINTVKTIPQFVGHNQPQIPYDVGFYDLSSEKVMYRQIELAKNYGIFGFCFHYYWFSGKRLLEKPIFNWLNNKELDFPFCLCWANENWSKLWDGGNKELLIKQEIKYGDKEKFLQDILPFFKDERYIKIDNKPLLVIYKIECVEEDALKDLISYLRTEITKYGFDGIYLLTTNKFIYDSMLPDKAKEIGFDATMEFPPHGVSTEGAKIKNKKFKIPNRNFKGSLIDMHKVIKEKLYTTNAKFKCVFPSWDNSPRKTQTGCIVMQTETEDYKQWLYDSIKQTKENNSNSEQIVFINAWNEWAEGAHLEPDIKSGYTNLQATREVLEQFE